MNKNDLFNMILQNTYMCQALHCEEKNIPRHFLRYFSSPNIVNSKCKSLLKTKTLHMCRELSSLQAYREYS